MLAQRKEKLERPTCLNLSSYTCYFYTCSQFYVPLLCNCHLIISASRSMPASCRPPYDVSHAIMPTTLYLIVKPVLLRTKAPISSHAAVILFLYHHLCNWVYYTMAKIPKKRKRLIRKWYTKLYK